MSSVFRDPLLQQQFDKQGYVLVSSLINGGDIEELKGLFTKFREECNSNFHTTHFSTNVEYKKQVHDVIASVVGLKASPLLNDFIPLFGNFMIKNPDPENFMPLHADWTYVDESKFSSVAIWVPLVNVDAENGCFGVIEGSHQVTNIIRGPMLKQSTLQWDKEWEQRLGKLIPMKAGDAIIYNHRLLHYSPPNRSELARPAINLSLVPKGVPWLHYCKPEGADEIEVYGVTDTGFYIHYNNFQRPETGKLLAKLPNETIEYIDERMEKFGRPRGIFHQLRTWLGG